MIPVLKELERVFSSFFTVRTESEGYFIQGQLPTYIFKENLSCLKHLPFTLRSFQHYGKSAESGSARDLCI